MSRSKRYGRATALTLLAAASAVALTGCGKRGMLEQPAPLFGDRARAQYQEQQQQRAQDAADARARRGNTTAAADQSDDAPLTTRDIKAPEQKMIPASRQPLDGPSNPLGPSVNPNPPG